MAKIVIFIISFFCFCSSIFLINQIENFTSLSFNAWNWLSVENLKVDVDFYIDQVSCIFSFMISAMASLVSLYLIGIKKGKEKSSGYLILYSLLVFFSLVTVFSGNLVMFILSWSITGIITWIMSDYSDEIKRISGKLLLPNALGEFSLLIGAIGFYLEFGTVSFPQMTYLFHSTNSFSFPSMIYFFTFLGIFIKIALIPFHYWFINFKNVQNSLLIMIGSGTTLSLGILLLARLSPFLHKWEYFSTTLCLFGGSVALLGIAITIIKRSVREILLFSTIYHFGMIIVSFGVGAYINAIFYAIGHCFWKGPLLIGETLILQKTQGRGDIFQIGDIKKSSPWIFWCFLISSIPFLGVPGISSLFFQHEILQGAYLKNMGDEIFFILIPAIALGPFSIMRLITSIFIAPTKTKIKTDCNFPLPIIISFIGAVLMGLLVNIGGFPKNYLWENLERYNIILENPLETEIQKNSFAPHPYLIFTSISLSLSMAFISISIYFRKKQKLMSVVKYSCFPIWNFIDKEFKIHSFFKSFFKILYTTIRPILFILKNILAIPLKTIGLIIYQIGLFLNLKDFKNIEGGILYIILGATIMVTFIFNNFKL